MGTVRTPPGHAAAAAFRLCMVATGVLGLATIAVLYWRGGLSPLAAGYALVALFPVYMLVVAAGASVWLGYDKDAAALRPVTRGRKE